MIAELIPEELHPHAVFAIKAIHLLAFLMIQTAIFYLIYKGLRRESDKSAGIAFAIATGETLIYVGNGFRCPLTGLAEGLGAEDGSVTGILLPRWLAMNIVNIYGPLLALGLALHARNLIRPLVRRPRLLRLPPATEGKPAPGSPRPRRSHAMTDKLKGRTALVTSAGRSFPVRAEPVEAHRRPPTPVLISPFSFSSHLRPSPLESPFICVESRVGGDHA